MALRLAIAEEQYHMVLHINGKQAQEPNSAQVRANEFHAHVRQYEAECMEKERHDGGLNLVELEYANSY